MTTKFSIRRRTQPTPSICRKHWYAGNPEFTPPKLVARFNWQLDITPSHFIGNNGIFNLIYNPGAGRDWWYITATMPTWYFGLAFWVSPTAGPYQLTYEIQTHGRYFAHYLTRIWSRDYKLIDTGNYAFRYAAGPSPELPGFTMLEHGHFNIFG